MDTLKDILVETLKEVVKENPVAALIAGVGLTTILAIVEIEKSKQL